MTAPILITPDRATYIRSHAWMAVLGMGGAMLILWLMGNPYVWTGAVAGLAAIAARGWYMASEELGAVWQIKDGEITGPLERRIALSNIEQVRGLLGNVQIITKSGDKHLIKYQADTDTTIDLIKGAM